jgi:hypothetical protein
MYQVGRAVKELTEKCRRIGDFLLGDHEKAELTQPGHSYRNFHTIPGQART